MSWYDRERKKLIHLLGAHCWMCGDTYKLEFHHAGDRHPENRNGGKGNLLHARETIRHGGRVWLLCFRCHTLVDPDRKAHPPNRDKLWKDMNVRYVDENLISKEVQNQKTTSAKDQRGK